MMGYNSKSRIVFRIAIIVLACIFFSGFYYLVLSAGEEITIYDLYLTQKDITSFRGRYLTKSGTKQEESVSEGGFVFKEKVGFIYDTVFSGTKKENRIKIVENFSQQVRLEYNYAEHTVHKVNYKAIPKFGDFDAQFISWGVADMLLPFKYKILEDSSIKIEEKEKTRDREFIIISAIIAKFPFLDRKCRFWQAKDNKLVYKFIIYNDKDEPISFFEITEVEINPKIDDAEFNIEIPPTFKEMDVTNEFKRQYGILSHLNKLYTALRQDRISSNEQFIENITRTNDEFKKKLEFAGKRKDELEQKYNDLIRQTAETGAGLKKALEASQKERDELKKEYVELSEKTKEELASINQRLEVVKKERDKLKEIYLKIDSKVKDRGRKPLTSKSGARESSILFVNRALGFVGIGLGQINGLAIGDIFEVSRDKGLLGKIAINKVYEDMAIADAITHGLIDIIKEGDKVVGIREVGF